MGAWFGLGVLCKPAPDMVKLGELEVFDEKAAVFRIGMGDGACLMIAQKMGWPRNYAPPPPGAELPPRPNTYFFSCMK